MNIINYINGKNLCIDKKETYRYLGYHFGGEIPADAELDKIVDELSGKLKDIITPRCAYELYNLTVSDNTCNLSLYNISASDDSNSSDTDISSDNPLLSIHSARLSAHIKNCRYAILFAATIGPGADMLIRRYSGRSTIKPAILQAAGAAAIEAFADDVTETVRSQISLQFSSSKTNLSKISSDIETSSASTVSKPETVNFKMRFSPGYGDFSLEHQKDFFMLLQLEKNLGMSLNTALLMSPSKSITAIIGVL